MPKRTFQLAELDELEGDEPIEFDLAYKVKGLRGMREEVVTLACLPFLPPAAMRLISIAESNNTAAIAFIDRCLLTDEDSDKFLRLVNDRKVAIRADDLGEILEWLTEVYSGHPTESPALSEDGPTRIGDSSGDD